MAATASFITRSLTRVIATRDGRDIAPATGFFLKFAGNWYLVSNWHVFSGCNPATGQPLSRSGIVPDGCRFFSLSLSDKGIQWTPRHISFGSAIEGTALWYQHPVFGQAADVAALPIGAEDIGKAIDLLDDAGHAAEMFIDLGQELFLPGYPLGLTGGGQFPLWKRATLASSLEWGPGVDRYLYVDTASREGMSGSPCFAISNWKHYRLDRETGKFNAVRRPMSWRLIGIYSGRRKVRDDLGAQIGIVWRERLITETIEGQANGSVSFNVPDLIEGSAS